MTIEELKSKKLDELFELHNEMVEDYGWDNFIWSSQEWSEYCNAVGENYLICILTSRIKNFNATDKFKFMDKDGAYQSFNSKEDANCPFNYEELLEYLNNKNN